MSDNNIFFDMVLSFEAIMNKKISKIVGARIKMLRQQHGMTGSELGALLGVSQQHQSRFENGECNIHVDVIYLLSYIFKVKLNYFFQDINDCFDQEGIAYKESYYHSETIVEKYELWR